MHWDDRLAFFVPGRSSKQGVPGRVFVDLDRPLRCLELVPLANGVLSAAYFRYDITKGEDSSSIGTRVLRPG